MNAVLSTLNRGNMAEVPQRHTEQAASWTCEGERVVGVLARPLERSVRGETGVLVVVGGPQYRAGSHRHFVQLSRELAGQGWPVLRFDARGMGDGSGSKQHFEDLAPDIGAALDAFWSMCPSLRSVVLWGLCDGASAALLYLDARADPRVTGLVLLNPWVRSADTLAKAQVKQYYAARLLDPAMWQSLFSGRIGLASLQDFARTLLRVAKNRLRPAPAPAPAFHQRMLRAWQRFTGPTLLVLSGKDLTAKEFQERVAAEPAWMAAMKRPLVQVQALHGADHTLSGAEARRAHGEALTAWLSGEPATSPSHGAAGASLAGGPR